MRYKNIIWDWNGTLLDDVEIAVRADNDILAEYGLEPIGRELYLRSVEVPIIKFYEKIFDLSIMPFAEIAPKFMINYNKYIAEAGLMDGAEEALQDFAVLGVNQMIISSFEESLLNMFVKKYGISHYFSIVSGSENINSESKIDRALRIVREAKIKPQETVIIGDMVHDKEMADAIGADCMLIAGGHQGRADLERSGAYVAESLRDAVYRLNQDYTGIK